MSEAAAPAAAAPAAAPASPAPSSGGSPPPAASASAPAAPSGLQAPPPAVERTPVPWKTKAKIGDAEHEVDLDVSPFLETYKRKVKLDGEEVEIGLDDAYKSTERAKASFKRFEEAAKERKAVDAERAQLTQQIERIERRLSSPDHAPAVMRQALGAKYTSAVVADLRRAVQGGDRDALEAMADVVAERLEYERLPPEQRQQRDAMTAAEMRAAQREQQAAQREREIDGRERAMKASEERRIDAMAQVRQRELVAEWTPALERAGLPATPRVMREVARVISDARANKIPKTLADAISEVAEDLAGLTQHAAQRQQAAVTQAVAQQPGAVPPQAPTTAPKPRDPSGRFQGDAMTAEQFARDLRSSWGKKR